MYCVCMCVCVSACVWGGVHVLCSCMQIIKIRVDFKFEFLQGKNVPKFSFEFVFRANVAYVAYIDCRLDSGSSKYRIMYR